MAREEDGDGRIVHEVEYDGYSDRRWWHMLDDERWRVTLFSIYWSHSPLPANGASRGVLVCK